MLNSVLFGVTSSTLTIHALLLCTIASLVMGFVVACIYMFRNTYSKGFVMTLVLLPATVQMIILLVNGNVGTGVAVMGAFSLVRFRSTPGGAREISSIFLAMAIGLATGMGYIGIAAISVLMIGFATLILAAIPFGDIQTRRKMLHVTIPEDVSYTNLFDDLFTKYTTCAKLMKVKTTNLGSLFELRYEITLKCGVDEKAFLDEIRCRNGNLNIVCGQLPTEEGL